MVRAAYSTVAAVAVAIFLSRSALADPLDKVGFADFLAKVQSSASSMKPDPNVPGTLRPDSNQITVILLKDVSYGEGALDGLKAALAAAPVTDVGVYTAGRLLVPLLSSDVEVVRKAVPFVTAAHGRLVRYQLPAFYSKAELKGLELSATPDPRASAEVNLKVLSEYADRHHKRMEADGRISRYNMQCVVFENVLWRVLLRSGRPADDDRVAAGVVRSEQAHFATYRLPLEAITLAAGQLDKARSAKLYSALEKAGRPLEFVEANYIDPTRLHFGVNENSYLVCPMCFPGVDMLTAANALAETAKMPVLPLPSKEDVAANTLLMEVKTLLSQGKKFSATEVQRAFSKLAKDYPKSRAYEEARKLQPGGAPGRT